MTNIMVLISLIAVAVTWHLLVKTNFTVKQHADRGTGRGIV